MYTKPSSDYLKVDLKQDRPISLNVLFSCQQHELIVLVGPSGSGKTTLLRSIAGLYQTQKHFIQCNEEIWSDHNKRINLPTQKRKIGLVFQHYALFPHLNVMRNIELACDHYPPDKRKGHVMSMLQLVNLDGLQDRYPVQLSGGQQQRVALARALAREPDILLLDEPFSAVDQVTRRKLRRELASLRQKLNIPIILVTHDLDEARMLADRMCILHNGSLLQTGVPDEVLSRPANAEVARLVDLNNLFTGEIIRHDQVKQLTYLRWNNLELECVLNESFKPNSNIDWVIPPDSIILHRKDRPSHGERENPVPGTIQQAIQMGETTTIVMTVTGNEQSLSFNIPTHVARRNQLLEGEIITVSLLANAIHIMPRTQSLKIH
jgi:molybdate transport system ATP-binding protein